MNSFNEFMKTTVFGVPLIVILAIFFIVILYLLKRKPGEPSFKRTSMSKELKRDLDTSYKQFKSIVNKPLSTGLTRIGYAMGDFTIYWDKNISAVQNIKKRKKQNFKPKEQDLIEMRCIKVCGKSLHQKVLAKMFNFRTKYYIIDENMITDTITRVIIDPKVIPANFYNVTIFSPSARDYIENVAFKLNRQNELEEIVNQIPKQTYLEVGTARAVAKARERAEIEKEKYKGQIESAEDS